MQLYIPATKQHTGLYRRFSGYLPHFTDTIIYMCIRLDCTTCPTLERITAPQHLQHIQDTSTTPDTVQVNAAAYYNKVYKGAAVRRYYRSMPDSAAHRRPCKPGGLQSGSGAVQRHGRGGRRGTIDGYRRISFRAFAR